MLSTKRTFWQRIKAAWREFKKTHNEDGFPVIQTDNFPKDKSLVIIHKD
jgi:hypothetical protein